MKLEDKVWKEFNIENLFIVSGSTTTHPSRLCHYGKTPRITCSSLNNGIEETYQNKATEDGGVITIDSATIGYVGFQETDFIATDHVEKISLKNNQRMCRYLGLGLKTSILSASLNKFNYGYKFSQSRIKKQTILLPTDSQNSPDYRFLKQYTKSIIDKKIDRYKKHAKAVLEKLQYKKINNLQDKKWREFFLTDIFTTIQRGKRLTKGNQIKGETPYVSSTASNNGIDNYIGNKEKVRIFSDCLSIANSGSVGASFYHPYEFVASDHITHLKNEELNEFVYLFIVTLSNRFSGKYNFNREINDFRISREKILLPINSEGTPDYEYMEQYVINMKHKKIKQYLDYLEKQKKR